MKSFAVVLLLASLLSLSHGFRAGLDYYGFGRIAANYYTFGSTDQARGIYTFIYHAKTLVLEYNVITTLPNVGMVTINGPARCYSPLVGTYQQSDAACVSNTGPIVYNLGKGIVTPDGQDLQYQIFSGSVSMNNVEEDMLFNGELYVVVSKQVPDANNKYQDVPYLRGGLIVQGTQSSNQDNIFSIVKFEPYSKSKYPLPSTSQPKTRSSNSGVGYLYVSGTQMTMTANFFTTVPGNPSYLLRCGDTQKLLIPNENPGEQQITFTADENNLLLEYLIGNCFFFITSAANPDGDIFGAPTTVGMFESIGLGAKETPAVSSGGLFYAVTNFDKGVKILDIVFRHNLTTTDITSIVVTDATTSTTLCTYTPPTSNIVNHFYCRLNDTQVATLEKSKISINILTTQNPSGELLGQVNFMGKATTLGGSTAFSKSTAIGLGVGLGIGIPILLAVIVGVVFLVKKGGTNSKI